MPRQVLLVLATVLLLGNTSLAQLPGRMNLPTTSPVSDFDAPDLRQPPALLAPANGKNGGDKDDGNGEKPDKPPRTLFEWAVGPKADQNGNGEEEEEDTIVTDRPDFTEASTTVGRGRIQLEAGYTYFYDKENGIRSRTHSYPEMLWRIGMFADWLELRIVQNFDSFLETDNNARQRHSGAEDFVLGCKIALAEQKGCWPELAMIVQCSFPTGADAFTAKEVLPGGSLLYSWEVIPDCLDLGGSTVANRSNSVSGLPGVGADIEVRHAYLELAQSVTLGYTLGKKLSAYTEWFAFFPSSALDPEIGPEYYFNGGFTYLITNNIQFDIRAGVGLNRHADDFFTGSGLSIRY